MKVILAEKYGFCFGVKNTIDKSLEVVEKNSNIHSLGSLIHNDQVMGKMMEKGLTKIEDIKEATRDTVIIRAHGEPYEVYEKAKEENIKLIDTTCVFVRRIQEKVREYKNKGYEIVIVGSEKHPEVIGINGWCDNKAFIVNSKEDDKKVPKCDKLCIVAQTTIRQDVFDEVVLKLRDRAETIEVFNTICNATEERQKACEKLAKKVDAMVVIGGKSSSNTKKLVEISQQYCKTYHIETAQEIEVEELEKFDTIGVTAGASTPNWIIEEVVDKLDNTQNEMNNFMEEIERSMSAIKKGDTVKGQVISVTNGEVMVNVGYKADGIIKRTEFSNDPEANLKELVSEGDEIEVYVVTLNDGEGNVILSKKKVDDIKGWEKLEELYKSGEQVEAKIIQEVKGGLITLVNGLRTFMPGSHVSTKRVQDLSALIGTTVDVKMIDFDREKRRAVVSRREIEAAEAKELADKFWSTLVKGEKVKGEVKRLEKFGAFVDIGGVDGLVHISDLSWTRVNHPSEVVKPGDIVEVYVLDFDREKSRISLGLKQTMAQPWDNISDKYKEGDVVEGKVVRFAGFGAFVELEKGVDGLVHISQIANERVTNIANHLEIGQVVKVKVLEIKEEEKRMSLSIKQTLETEEVKEVVEEFEGYSTEEEEDIPTIADMIKEK